MMGPPEMRKGPGKGPNAKFNQSNNAGTVVELPSTFKPIGHVVRVVLARLLAAYLANARRAA